MYAASPPLNSDDSCFYQSGLGILNLSLADQYSEKTSSNLVKIAQVQQLIQVAASARLES